MSKIAGRWSNIYFAGYDLTGKSNQYEASVEFAEDDMTAFMEECENSIPDIPKAIASLTAFLDAAAGASHAALGTPGGYTAKILNILIGANAAPTVGDMGIGISVDEFKYNTKHQLKNSVLADAAFSGMGGYAPDFNGFVLANSTITNTLTGASVNNGAASANGGVGYLQVLSVLASDTYVIKIQHSTNNSTWVDLISFVLNGSAIGAERIAVSGNVYQYLRVLATRTGSGQSLKLATLFARL
jgi:hypothetical protein